MASAAQLQANQANAQQSTGPRSVEGKARVAQNALRHGLTSKHLVVRENDREEFEEFQSALLAELAPEGAVETITFHELLHAAWNLHRFRRLEAQSSTGGYKDLMDPAAAAVLDRLGRYQARAQRAYYKALKELRTLQTDRALRRVKLEAQDAAEVPALAAIKELTKQTQFAITAKGLQPARTIVNHQSDTLRLDLISRTALKPEPPAPSSLALRL